MSPLVRRCLRPFASVLAATMTLALLPAAAGAPRDTIIVGSWQQPRNLLDYVNSQAITVEVFQLYRPPFVFTNGFKFRPNPLLVDGELPTLANGGAKLRNVTVKKGEAIFNPEHFAVEPAAADAKARQLVVTVRIKGGLKWDDGQPLTARDFVFGWEKSCEKDSQALDVTNCPLGSIDGAGGIVADYKAPDERTLEVSFAPNALNPLYSLTPLGPQGGPLPEHVFKGMKAAEIARDERATGGEHALPLGYGPYRMKLWKKGDRIEFEPNPYWVGPPARTPRLIFRFFTDATAVVNALIAGEIDVTSAVTGVQDDQLPYLESVAKQGKIALTVDGNAASTEFLYLNYNDPADKTLARPHPVLGDYAVRKAISLAVDRARMVEVIYGGHAALVDQPQLPQMKSYLPELGRIRHDPVEARRLLDAAGWKPGADGVRVKNGARAHLRLLTTSGSAPRQKAAQILQSNLSELGIEVTTTFQPSSVVFSRDGIYGRNFDLALFAFIFTNVEPGNWWFNNAACGQIPTPANGYIGNNYPGWCNPAVSRAAADQEFLTLDEKQRRRDWETILKGYFAPPVGDDFRTGGYPVIALNTRPNHLATVPGIRGPALDPTAYFTWNVADWVLEPK